MSAWSDREWKNETRRRDQLAAPRLPLAGYIIHLFNYLLLPFITIYRERDIEFSFLGRPRKLWIWSTKDAVSALRHIVVDSMPTHALRSRLVGDGRISAVPYMSGRLCDATLNTK